MSQRVVIGVTGHRTLEHQDELSAQVRRVLGEIASTAVDSLHQEGGWSPNEPLILRVVSPLAEGADRIVAREVLQFPSSELVVILPLPEEDYVTDFHTPESRAEFGAFLSRAYRIIRIPPAATREAAYEAVGHYTVDHCDVLIALWDGQASHGRGGTAEIVAYARQVGRPLFWIHTDQPALAPTFERGHGIVLRASSEPVLAQEVGPAEEKELLRKIAESAEERDNHSLYSRERDAATPEHAAQVSSEREKLLRQARDAKITAPSVLSAVNAAAGLFLPPYVCADRLALRYQKFHNRAGSAIYSLAAVAVGIAAFQALFVREIEWVVLGEVAVMVAVLIVLWYGRREHWHEKWMDYRFLAELFRTGFFLWLAGESLDRLAPPRYLSLAFSNKDWTVKEFFDVWKLRPASPVKTGDWQAVRDFLAVAWLDDQIKYHQGAQKRNLARHRWRYWAGFTMFLLTVVAAAAHMLGAGPHLDRILFGWVAALMPVIRHLVSADHLAKISAMTARHLAGLDSWMGGAVLAYLSILLPAVGGALGALRMQREFLKSARRSDEMVRHLTELKVSLNAAEVEPKFHDAVREIQETMMYENEDWRVLVRFHELEPPA